MNDLKAWEKKLLERLFGMSSGYVLDFTNSTFAEFFREHGVDIYAEKYAFNGDSKAKRLRAFWEVEPNHLVADVLSALLDYWQSISSNSGEQDLKLAQQCREIAQRLYTLQHPSLDDVRTIAVVFDMQYLAQQVSRMEQSIESDPALAIGTAKELVETCCRTILKERGRPVEGTPDIPTLVKTTLKELELIPESIPEHTKGRDIIKRLLSNLASIVQGLAELRGHYGTGHGKEASAESLRPRHAKLAVGAATTLATFLFETHKEKEM